MDSDRRRRLTPEERRAQLLALGVAFLAERPLDDLTIEELSARAGVSRGLVFHYFGSKQGLHRAVVTTAGASMLAASAPKPALDPVERLRDTLARIVQFVREHRGTFFSLVRGVASGDGVVRTIVDDTRDVHAERIITVFLELGVEDSELLRVALRSWVSFAEEVLIELALGTEMDAADIVGFLERSARGVVGATGADRLP
ncbi:MAG: TetR/AcrR family transcriptional regulator [Microbacterium sp.]|uniref:TetR/AcrR family transcriptional regulator n=1 Tax=Microbacterium sp. TaxID=51671 RepID=UPI00260F0B0C|nr:TetR/AcrR family transcriptional regulator [Microbacterium sp.]MCX6503497.1 TetR/AcrR family transcriptional regulator [Microbacterium sp.]